MSRYVPLNFLLFIIFSCHQQQVYDLTVKRLSDRVITYNCLNVNTTAIAGDRGIVIIDTQRSPAIMSEIKALISKELDRDDFLFVINTHGHWDHTSGNQVFPESTLIGQENCPACIRQYPANSIFTLGHARYRLARLKANRAGKSEVRSLERLVQNLEKNYVATPPRRTFRDSLTLDAGNITIRLFYCGNGHSNSDILVHVPEEKLVLTGDLFNDKESFSLSVNKMNDIPRLVATLDLLLNENNVETVVTGHNGTMSGNDLNRAKELLEEKYREYDNKRSAAVVLREMIANVALESLPQRYEEFKNIKSGGHYFLEDEFIILGKNLLCEGRSAQATTVFRITVDQFPGSALAYDYLAEAFLLKGENDSAIAYYEKSLRSCPENTNAQEMLEIVR